MSDFSDLGSDTDVGSETPEVENTDTDYGDGDGVNEFDETYNETQGDSSDFSYDESGFDASESDAGSEEMSNMSSEEVADNVDTGIEDDSSPEPQPVSDYNDDNTGGEMSTEEMADAYNDSFEGDLNDDPDVSGADEESLDEQEPAEEPETEEPEPEEEPESVEESGAEEPESVEEPEVEEPEAEEPESVEEPEAEEPETVEEPEAEEPKPEEEPELEESEAEEQEPVEESGAEEPESVEEPETEEPEPEEESALEESEAEEPESEEPESVEEPEPEEESEPVGETEPQEESESLGEAEPEDTSDNADEVDNQKEAENVSDDSDEETEQEQLENCNYNQGQNDLGAQGTCGPTSVANALNRVTGTNEYTENDVLHSAMDNDLCRKSDNPLECGGTTTKDVVDIIDKVKDPESNIHTEVCDYDKALDVDSLADRLDDAGTVAIVGVDSATLWDQRGDVSNSGLFQDGTESPSDHWITVDSPVRDGNGNVTGFNIVDSGGGVGYVDRDKFESMYMGDENHKVSDPTAVIVSNKGDAVNTYSQSEGVERASNYKGNGSGLPSDMGSPPKFAIDKLGQDEIDRINTEAKETGTERTWQDFQNDPKNQERYSTLEEAKEGYKRVVEDQSPWPDGETPEYKEIPVGTRFEMAMAPGQPDDRPGGFGTMSHIEDKEFVRNDLAVKEDWKPDIDRINTYEVIKPLPANVGDVGSQVDVPADRYLAGGADQFEMKVNTAERMQYIKFVDSREVK